MPFEAVEQGVWYQFGKSRRIIIELLATKLFEKSACSSFCSSRSSYYGSTQPDSNYLIGHTEPRSSNMRATEQFEVKFKLAPSRGSLERKIVLRAVSVGAATALAALKLDEEGEDRWVLVSVTKETS